jgi:hypothetical protein
MTVIDFNKIPRSSNSTTILDLVNALNDQVNFARGISDAILGVQEIKGDPAEFEGPLALITAHVERLAKIATELDELRTVRPHEI